MRSERGDFNSCGKWSSGVLPLMLWWSLEWFPYFYLGCPWPYCAPPQKKTPQVIFTPLTKILHSAIKKSLMVPN